MPVFNSWRPLDSDRHETHICWRWIDGANQWHRNDGAVLTRSSSFSGWELELTPNDLQRLKARDVGDIDDSAALAWVDEHHPCPPPHPMAGQVWAAENLKTGTYAEIMVVGALRQPGGFLAPVYNSGFKPGAQWPLEGMTLVWGPGAPWAPPVPHIKVEELQ